MSNELKLEMKTKNKIRRITEPMVYVVLVAAFGFITTFANHIGRDEQLRDAELASITLENEIQQLFAQEETGVSF
jgi:hypothetical protein